MSKPIIFRNAQLTDWDNIAALLTAAGLPLAGAQAHLPNFVVAIRKGELVGCAGLEVYDRTGLLRSLAVTEGMRGMGLGQALVHAMIDQARHADLQNLVLLTETAQGFFPKFGFREISRAEVPWPALASVEFQTACPESAVVMQLDF